ncbi:malate permease [Aspergillus pseudonomiae]|uniref:Sulfite efflux pump SSU1 n=1 Tax=Aspergillus pseudonomiae TaxID=1506151 RepID=A0A5N7DMX9_9EURO|nr:malate permease [Aspergillus pseudonomiae]KAB8259911.1 malate permease [Aspergillus pseudonomiae]KAE8407802.1 malate permease [Aspergillus pseudonomiae]
MPPAEIPEPIERSKHDVGWRKVVRNFTPSWFSVNMGTGIVSILLNTLPYNGQWLYYISIIVFILNVAYFIVFLAITLLRYILYPEIFEVMVTHPVQSLFLGTFPMGLATIINMFCFVCVPPWGDGAAYFICGVWVFDAVVSVVVAIGIPFLLTARNNGLDLSSMTAAWLLPIVSCVVAAASGSIVADILPDAQFALGIILASYILWGIGVPLAMMVICIYLQRLMFHKLPPKGMLVSVFLPLGPLGQGSYGIQRLGRSAQTIFPKTGTLSASTGEIFYSVGFLIGILLWAFGVVWLSFAVATLVKTRKFPFNMGWWALTFPLGVFTTSTCSIGQELPSRFFSVLGTVLSVAVVILWLLVSYYTSRGIIRGDVFVAPCLENLRRGKA